MYSCLGILLCYDSDASLTCSLPSLVEQRLEHHQSCSDIALSKSFTIAPVSSYAFAAYRGLRKDIRLLCMLFLWSQNGQTVPSPYGELALIPAHHLRFYASPRVSVCFNLPQTICFIRLRVTGLGLGCLVRVIDDRIRWFSKACLQYDEQNTSRLVPSFCIAF